MSDIEGDSHLAQIAEANAAAIPERTTTDSGWHATANAPAVIMVNQLSTPVLITLLAVIGFIAMASGIGISLAWHAADKAAIAEREGRLAEEAAMHLRSTMRAYGITLAGKKQDREEEEPVEP